MPELNNTPQKSHILHEEKGEKGYTYLDIKGMKVILINHKINREEIHHLHETIGKQISTPLLIVENIDKTIDTTNLSSLEALVDKISKSECKNFNIEPIKLVEPYLVEPYINTNPQRNSKSSNCKIRRK